MNGWRSAIGWASQLPGAGSRRSGRCVPTRRSAGRAICLDHVDPPLARAHGRSCGPHSQSLTRASRVASSLQQDRCHALPARRSTRTSTARAESACEADVRRGLTAWPKSLPPKYFYDRAGSLLFERITELPEYYLTRTEAAPARGNCCPVLIGRILPDDIVEIGAGSSGQDPPGPRRAQRRPASDPLRAPRRGPAHARGDRRPAHSATIPGSHVHAVVGDFERDLAHVPPPTGRRLVLFLGSTIGNLDPPARARLLAGSARSCSTPAIASCSASTSSRTCKVLEAAYDDAAGVTREFNRNILRVSTGAWTATSSPRPSATSPSTTRRPPASRCTWCADARAGGAARAPGADRPASSPARASGRRAPTSSRATASRRCWAAASARPRAVARRPRELLRPGARRAAVERTAGPARRVRAAAPRGSSTSTTT